MTDIKPHCLQCEVRPFDIAYAPFCSWECAIRFAMVEASDWGWCPLCRSWDRDKYESGSCCECSDCPYVDNPANAPLVSVETIKNRYAQP